MPAVLDLLFNSTEWNSLLQMMEYEQEKVVCLFFFFSFIVWKDRGEASLGKHWLDCVWVQIIENNGKNPPAAI